VRAGHHPILAAVQEQHRRANLPGVESPRGDTGQVVVHHPAKAAFHGLLDDGKHPGPGAREGGMIGGGEQLRVVLGRRQVRLQRRASLSGGAQLRRAGGHAREPVEPWAW
jgi:hypothetical protein